MRRADFLVEIQTEELPPQSLLKLAEAFCQEIVVRLQKCDIAFGKTQFFATPRRLAVRIEKLASHQPDVTVERKGPALKAAFDATGKPTQACLGFARSLGITPADLITITQAQGEWVGYNQAVQGQAVQTLLPTVVREALNALPIAKRMRWANHSDAFVRPIHAIVMLYGRDIVPAELFGCQAGRMTWGHRFMSRKPISIATPNVYEKTLAKNFVIADFFQRRDTIREAVLAAAKAHKGAAVIDDALLNEVTGLVEWPVALVGKFDATFLSVPQDILISAMEDHQRYFPVVSARHQLLPYFIVVSNIISRDPASVVLGNERVLRARLSDAAFFYNVDKKMALADRAEKLKHIIFQAKLGTLYDKSQRLMKLTQHIAEKTKADNATVKRAAELAKCDLTTEVVSEFPELQGIMGQYYALHDGETKDIAHAIGEQYLPRFAGDVLPKTIHGCVLALADRLDTLIGIFGIQEAPTGDRDPYALRRAAAGILRILIEKKLDLDVRELLQYAFDQYPMLPNKNAPQEALTFILDRLKPWYQEQGVAADVLAAVISLNITRPYDFHQRVQAVRQFAKCPEAASLSVANKRVSNILARAHFSGGKKPIDNALFEHATEEKLSTLLAKKRQIVLSFSQSGKYTEALNELASLRVPIDDFFAHVMVMADDKARRQNRLQLLCELRALFLHVADIAYLQ
ncbi:MAG: glycine--tRNA ligase subunit beta [Gammaproteobacteria bacterium]|nr:glycine--tRNA ligase subunit beta [Gammaproteobacteria bacterium]